MNFIKVCVVGNLLFYEIDCQGFDKLGKLLMVEGLIRVTVKNFVELSCQETLEWIRLFLLPLTHTENFDEDTCARLIKKEPKNIFSALKHCLFNFRSTFTFS